MSHKIKTTLLSILLMVNTSAALADYILTAPPRETPAAGQALYGPLAQHLSDLLGKKVTYEHPGDWKTYEKHMKAGRYDIVFDGPHFAAWRIDRQQARPLVKLPGKLDFVLVVKKDQASVRKLRHLVGKKVCTLPSPNLGAMTLYSMYPNPTREPEYVAVTGGMKQVAKGIESGKCVAGIMRSSFYEKKLSDAQRGELNILAKSTALINQGITVSQRIPQDAQVKIIASLTQGEGSQAAKPLFERFSRKAQSFEPADGAEYANLNLLKQNMMFGW